jgi:hypothetical protein
MIWGLLSISIYCLLSFFTVAVIGYCKGLEKGS